MSISSRRKWITTAAASVAGTAVAAKLAARYGLIPPDHGGLYGPGATLTYATHRLLTANSLAREYPRSAISPAPFANGTPLKLDAYLQLKNDGFRDWRLHIDGLVERPSSYSLDELKALPARSQITQLICEEGWSFIAEWTGTPLAHLLQLAGVRSQATFVVYRSFESDWWDSLDMAEALHPQTLVTHTMNGAPLPAGHGGPLRMRVPRQLGYKSVKYLNRITVTDDITKFGKGLGSPAPEFSYSWYAGI